MTTKNEKTHAINFCQEILEILAQLENLLYRKNDLIREFKDKEHKVRNWRAMMWASILPLLILLYIILVYPVIHQRFFFSDNISDNIVRALGLLFICSIIFMNVCMVYVYLWNRKHFLNRKEKVAQQVLKKMSVKEEALKAEGADILSRPILNPESQQHLLSEKYFYPSNHDYLFELFQRGSSE